MSIRFKNSSVLDLIASSSIIFRLFGPNSSTQKEATTDPKTNARFMFSKEKSSVFAKNPINPPAKESPAPVGSNTSSEHHVLPF